MYIPVPKERLEEGGEVKWKKASMAAWFWACLDDLQETGESKEKPLTETEALKQGLWSGPSFMAVYVGNPHCFPWQTSCSLLLYILISAQLSSPSGRAENI